MGWTPPVLYRPLLPGCLTRVPAIAVGILDYGDHIKCGDPEQTWGRLSHCTLERTQIIAKPRKPLAKETLQLTVEDDAANLQQLMSPLRGPAHGLLLAHSVIDEVSPGVSRRSETGVLERLSSAIRVE